VKACEVNIYGQTYTLHADIDTEEVTRVAKQVDSQMRAVAKASPSASAVQVAVLAALAIASEKGSDPQAAAPGMNAIVEKRVDAMIRLIELVDTDSEPLLAKV
jgi:hypothetical protein